MSRFVEFLQWLVYLLLSPFFAVRHFFGERFERMRYSSEMETGQPKRPWWKTLLFSPILLPLWFVRRAVPWFFFLLFHPANRKKLLLGVPALVVASVAIVLLVLSFIYPKQRLVSRYDQAGFQAFNRGDFEQATIYYEKLCYLEPTEDRYRFLLARVREERNEWVGAYGIMAGLAPLDEYRYGPAHLWMASRLVYQPELILNLDRRLSVEDRPRLVRYHIEGALEANPEDPVALTLKATVIEPDEPREALAIFERLAQIQPKLNLRVARIQKRLGNEEAATDSVDQYQEVLKSRLETRPIPTGTYVDWVTCDTMKDEYEAALRFSSRYAGDIRPEIVRELQANIYVEWASDILDSDAPDALNDGLIKVTEALRLQPELPQAYDVLQKVIQGSDEHRIEVRKQCEKLIAEGVNSGMMQVVLGTLLLSEGEVERAELALRLAISLESRAGPALNNLAWLLATKETPEFDKAVELIDQAVALQPDRVRYRFTRGKIYFRMEEFDNAVLDLEAAHQAFPKNLEILVFCARAHEALGNLSQADAYKAQFEALRRPSQDQDAGEENPPSDGDEKGREDTEAAGS